MSRSDDTGVKVARIIARLNIGGPAIQAVLLTHGLSGDSFSSTLITGVVGRNEGDMTSYALEKGVRPLVIPELGREVSLKDDPAALWKLILVLRKIRPHIVHTHTAKAGFLGRVAALLAGVPVRVHTFHGHVFHGYFSSRRTKFFLMLERLLARMTDRLVVVSDSQREELVSKYQIADESKFHVVPLGFDLSPFEALPGPGSIRSRLGLPSDTILIGFIGRLVPIKNPFLLIEALSLLKAHLDRVASPSAASQGERMHAVIVGGGELDESLRRCVKETGLQEAVTFIGWQREMAPLYADFDLVALTSDNEGTPAALIEAMASGKPFVATDVGGVRDLMCGQGQRRNGQGETGFVLYGNGVLIPRNDARALASALFWFARNRGMARRMGDTGRQFAQTHFGKERLFIDTQGLYNELLDAKGIRVGDAPVLAAPVQKMGG